MASDDESKSSSVAPATAQSPRPPARRSRRGGRRHSRGARGPRVPVKDPQPGVEAQEPEATAPEATSFEAPSAEMPAAVPTEGQPETETPPSPDVPRASRLGSRLVLKSAQKPLPPAQKHSGIAKAIEQVNRITEELRRALFHMEEVLDTLELADRQKVEDEREIESLRRALRNLHEPRDGGREEH